MTTQNPYLDKCIIIGSIITDIKAIATANEQLYNVSIHNPIIFDLLEDLSIEDLAVMKYTGYYDEILEEHFGLFKIVSDDDGDE